MTRMIHICINPIPRVHERRRELQGATVEMYAITVDPTFFYTWIDGTSARSVGKAVSMFEHG